MKAKVRSAARVRATSRKRFARANTKAKAAIAEMAKAVRTALKGGSMVRVEGSDPQTVRVFVHEPAVPGRTDGALTASQWSMQQPNSVKEMPNLPGTPTSSFDRAVGMLLTAVMDSEDALRGLDARLQPALFPQPPKAAETAATGPDVPLLSGITDAASRVFAQAAALRSITERLAI